MIEILVYSLPHGYGVNNMVMLRQPLVAFPNAGPHSDHLWLMTMNSEPQFYTCFGIDNSRWLTLPTVTMSLLFYCSFGTGGSPGLSLGLHHVES